MNRGGVAEISLGALRNNLSITRQHCGNSSIIAVVKADAYGHGSLEVSRQLMRDGVNDFAVAYTSEGRVLRDGGIRARILVLFDRTGIEDFFDHDLTPVIHDLDTARVLSREAAKRKRILPVHVKVDTGMGRMGMVPGSFESGIDQLLGLEGIRIEGLLSHFPEAESRDRRFSLDQVQRFSELKRAVEDKSGRKIMAHMANSAAILGMPESLLDAVRPGLMLYGCSPYRQDYGLLPVMKVRTALSALRSLPAGFPVSYGRSFVTKRKSLIGVLPVGYADGYGRMLSNTAHVLVRGSRAPVVGRICMDLTMTDVTDVDGVSEGDEVVLMGRQGHEEISADEIAGHMKSISYEVLTSLGSRSRKVFVDA